MNTKTGTPADGQVAIPEHLRAHIAWAARWQISNAADNLSRVSPRDVAEFDGVTHEMRNAFAVLDRLEAGDELEFADARRLAESAAEDLVDIAKDDLHEDVSVTEAITHLEEAQQLRQFAVTLDEAPN